MSLSHFDSSKRRMEKPIEGISNKNCFPIYLIFFSTVKRVNSFLLLRLDSLTVFFTWQIHRVGEQRKISRF
jgi:hypothetical protein